MNESKLNLIFGVVLALQVAIVGVLIWGIITLVNWLVG